MSPKTQRMYLEVIQALAKRYGRSPDLLLPQEVQDYLLERHEAGRAQSTLKMEASAIRFFYSRTLARQDVAVLVPAARRPQRLPEVLNSKELARLFDATTCLRDRVLLMLTYGAGLRAGEVARLKVTGPLGHPPIDAGRDPLIFTLPHLLNPLLLADKSRVLALFFKTVSSILIEFGHRRGGMPGVTLVLHTWDQKLNPYFRLHCLIPAGYLSPGFTRWIPARPDFLFPTKALSIVLRCRFLEALQKTHAKRPILLPSSLHQLAHDQGLRPFLKRLQKKPWVVYAKAPCAGPQVVLDYLARYTHRTAISKRFLPPRNRPTLSGRFWSRGGNNAVH